MEDTRGKRHSTQGRLSDGPESLKDKELHLWVTYPDARQKKNWTGKRSRCSRKGLKLWAVVIIEEIQRETAFSYEVTLRAILKHGERLIRVWVCNDPQDQSEDASVFGYVSPEASKLTPLEERLCHIVAKRVYESIAATWGQPIASFNSEPVSVSCPAETPSS